MGNPPLTHIEGPWRAFQAGGPSALGLIVKRVSLAGKWGRGPRSVRPMDGTEPRCVAGAGELVEGPQPDTICIGSLRNFWQRISRDFDVL